MLVSEAALLHTVIPAVVSVCLPSCQRVSWSHKKGAESPILP